MDEMVWVGDGARPRYPEAESWYRELVEKVPAVVYVDAADEASSSIYVSPQSEILLGYAREEWLMDPELWVKTLHPEDKERALAAHHRARNSGGPFGEEYRLVARDDSVVWVRDEAAPLDGEEGSLGRRIGVLIDVTERKEAEEALRRSEERFRLVALYFRGEQRRKRRRYYGRNPRVGSTERHRAVPRQRTGVGDALDSWRQYG